MAKTKANNFNLNSVTNRNSFPSVLMLYGSDTFSMEEALAKILKMVIVEENDKMDLAILDGEDCSQIEIVNIASQLPMLSDKRVVVVKRFDKVFKERRKKTDTDSPIGKYLEGNNSSTILLLTIDDTDKKLDLKKFPFDIISKNHHTIEYPALYENQLPVWVVNRFASFGKKIALNTAELIVLQSPPNTQSLANEVDKIILYDPNTNDISLDYVLNIIGFSRQNTIFELRKVVAQRDIAKAISITFNIVDTSTNKAALISSIKDLFIKMWCLLEYIDKGLSRDEIAKQLGLKTAYFLDEYLIGTRKYSPTEISNAFLYLCEADLKIKSSNYKKDSAPWS
jgi:DNA polymerase-3 subunit delta